jgi:hypothetical protein
MKTAAKRPHAADMAMSGAALATLGREQKTRLILLMKQAWDKQHGSHAAADGPGDFETWRVQECLAVCGRRLSQARNEDFLPLRAHFNNMLGHSDRAFRDHMRHQEEPRIAALFRLEAECRKAADVLPDAAGYVRGMLRNRGTSLEEASPKILWHAIFTLRRKAQLERKAKG